MGRWRLTVSTKQSSQLNHFSIADSEAGSYPGHHLLGLPGQGRQQREELHGLQGPRVQGAHAADGPRHDQPVPGGLRGVRGQGGGHTAQLQVKDSYINIIDLFNLLG